MARSSKPAKLQQARKQRPNGGKAKLPDVHPDLEGFDVALNSYGHVEMTISIDELNNFLDREVDDPKLKQWNSDQDDDSAKSENAE